MNFEPPMLPKKRGRPPLVEKVRQQLQGDALVNNGLNRKVYLQDAQRKPRTDKKDPYITEQLQTYAKIQQQGGFFNKIADTETTSKALLKAFSKAEQKTKPKQFDHSKALFSTEPQKMPLEFRPQPTTAALIGQSDEPLQVGSFVDKRENPVELMQTLVTRLTTVRTNFEKLSTNMKEAQDQLETEIRKIVDKQVREALGEDECPEVPEGLVSTEIKCNNGETITGIPAPTQRYLKLRLRAAGLEDTNEFEEQSIKLREREILTKIEFYNEQLLHLQQTPAIPSQLQFQVHLKPRSKIKIGARKNIVNEIAIVDFTKFLEIGGLNQKEHNFNRVLSECANCTMILGGPFHTAIVAMPQLKDHANPGLPGASEIFGHINAQIIFKIEQTCRFAHLFHQNLLFTDQNVFRLRPGAEPEAVLTFNPALTAICRLSQKYVLTIDQNLMLCVHQYFSDGTTSTYKVIAQEKLEVLSSLKTQLTKDLLVVDKMQLINKSKIILVTARSRNIVILSLQEDGDFDKVTEQQDLLLIKTMDHEAQEQIKASQHQRKLKIMEIKRSRQTMENPEDHDLINSDDEDIAIDKEVIPEGAFEGLKKKKLGSSEVIEIPRVSSKQYLAPFCSNKYPQMIVSILPDSKSQDDQAIRIIFVSTFLMQVFELTNEQLVKKGNVGAACPGANPNPDHQSVFPLSRFHASSWPVALRQIDFANRQKAPSKLQLFDAVRCENITGFCNSLKDQRVIGVLSSQNTLLCLNKSGEMKAACFTVNPNIS